jgi:Putative Flp pilus-assembly TadE/G-like
MRRNRQAGQALYVTVASLVVLLGFAGLAIDMGALRYEKRIQQTAADAAALAGASNLGHGGVPNGAQNAAAANGFTDNGGGDVSNCGSRAAIGTVCVQVNNPPQSGPHSGNANYVEVLVAAVHGTYFMKVFGVTQETVIARAVATNLSDSGANSGCLYTLGSPDDTIEGISGNATLEATTCGIVDDGNFDPAGGALNVNAGTFGVSGTCCGRGSVTCTATPSSCPTYGMPASADPLSYLTPPCNSCAGGGSPGGPPYNPGTYSSLTIRGNGNANFNPGIYIFNGTGITCRGRPTITGTGVMFYFTGTATSNCSGSDTVQLTAPSRTNCPSCPAQYDGILMYQDPNDTRGPSLGGNTGTFYDGALYFPKSQITFSGSRLDVAMVVGEGVALSGPTVNLEGQTGLPTGVELATVATLVE